MDKILHKHLDNRLDIQESAKKMLEAVLDSIDLKAVVTKPEAELARIGHVAMGIAEAHAREAVEEGQRFAKEVIAKGKVLFQESEDPNLNEDEPVK